MLVNAEAIKIERSGTTNPSGKRPLPRESRPPLANYSRAACEDSRVMRKEEVGRKKLDNELAT